ncbi:MAG TPA: gluconate 2-dehydrogenase subunit 3 family protein [Pseudolabrys sp.]
MADDTIPRRRFLLGAGLAGTAVAAGLAPELPLPAQAETSPAPAPAPAAPADAEPDTLLLLTATEAAFVSSAVDAFIPADELSPSGTDCGLVVFIDRQLASEWGGGSKMYRSGPFHKGKPEQGYQLALTPRQFFQTGIAEANAWSHKTYGKEFDRLAPAKQVAALKTMEEGKAAFGGVPSRAFFNMLLSMTMDGFFADPAYGGNRNAASWKMLGFPGLPATYADKFEEYRNKRYVAPPRSMADFS